MHLMRDYPGRFIAMTSVALCVSLGGAAANFLAPKYLQEVQDWTPATIMVLYVLGGAFGIVGATIAGSLSDRLGRKRMTIALGLMVVALAMTLHKFLLNHYFILS